VTAAGKSVRADPGFVLRRALLAWGLGDLALGKRGSGVAWLAGETAAVLVVAYLAIGLAGTTWYLVPFVLGIGFLAAWALQAVRAYRLAQRAAAIGPTPPRSPAVAVAWLSLPLLLWGAGFWLVAAEAASPPAVVDRFETLWPQLGAGSRAGDRLGLSEADTDRAAAALDRLRELCAARELSTDCANGPSNLLRDVRFSVVQTDADEARAVAQVVAFERRPSTFLGFISGTELVPVQRETVLTIRLQLHPSPLPGGWDIGAGRWRVVNVASP
jgi:hypothetical protein